MTTIISATIVLIRRGAMSIIFQFFIILLMIPISMTNLGLVPKRVREMKIHKVRKYTIETVLM